MNAMVRVKRKLSDLECVIYTFNLCISVKVNEKIKCFLEKI